MPGGRPAAAAAAGRRRRGSHDPSPAEYERAARLRQALQEFARSTERALRRHGLTSERYQLLLLIKVAQQRGEPATVGSLAARLDLAKSTVTQLVRRAENLRLVGRDLAEHDARVRHLHLTPEGDRRLREAVAELQDDRSHILDLLARPAPGD